jgi:hypothetical protein
LGWRGDDLFEHQPARLGSDGVGRGRQPIAEEHGDFVVAFGQRDGKEEWRVACAKARAQRVRSAAVNRRYFGARFKSVANFIGVNSGGRNLNVSFWRFARAECELERCCCRSAQAALRTDKNEAQNDYH